MNGASLIHPDGTESNVAGEVSIGRADDNEVVLESPMVSRHHARIVPADERWFLEDRGSFNGTSLNGVQIQPGTLMPLRHADRILIGFETLVFSWPDELDDSNRTLVLEPAGQPLARGLSPFQAQVVRCLCEPWLGGGSLDELPTNEEIATRLGTPRATEAVKAALRRSYAKAGLTSGTPHAKRRLLCRVARQRGWI